MGALIELKALSVTYPGGVNALRNVSFSMPGHDILALVGESGCGKTTLARAVLGLLPDHARQDGEILWCGEPLTPGRMRGIWGSQIALISQNLYTSLCARFTIGSHFKLLHAFHGGNKPSVDEFIGILSQLHFANPGELLGRYPFELSGGMLQRVCIALAVSAKPRLLIADEPTSALDGITQQQLTDLLLELHDRQDMAILLITHDLSVAARMARRIAVIVGGGLVELGPAELVLKNPRHPYTRLLLQALPDFGKRELPVKKRFRDQSGECGFSTWCDEYAPDCPELRRWRKEGEHAWICRE